MSFYHWFPSHPNECELSGGVDKLHDIGQELRVSAARQENRPPQTDFQRISSVPDVWSQHRLFDMLLLNNTLDPSYVEYETIAKREWRAMLAIIVLAESYGVSLQTKTIVFDDGQPVNSYIKAAYSVRPNRDSWGSMDIYYIQKDGKEYPIAMTSPTVHLVPTKDAWENLRAVYPGRIPWLTSDMANAPVVPQGSGYVPFMLGAANEERFYAMLPVHALMLKEWLSLYRKQTPETQNRDILMEYEKALSAAYGLNSQNMPNVAEFFAAETQRTGLRIFNMRVPNKLQVFLDRVFCTRIEDHSSIGTVLDTHRLAGGIGAQSILSEQRQNGEFAHFFVPMPVTETFWQLWNGNADLKPTYVVDSDFNAKSAEITKITVTVTFGNIQFSKTYSATEIDTEQWRNLCTAGIWPRQKIADWSDYFMFCYEANDYRIEPLKKRPEYRAKTYEKRDGIDGPITYYKLTYAPECCVLLKALKPIGYFIIRDRNDVPRGDDAKVYRASIDFGTSSTTLFGAVDSNAAKRINGMNLWSLPLVNTLDIEGHENSRIEKFFFPPLPKPIERAGRSRESETLKTATFETLRNNSDLAASYPSCIPMQTILADALNSNEAHSFLRDCWIYFRGFTEKRKVEIWPKVFTNLKWSRGNPGDDHRIRAMLAQILEMIALEARSLNCGTIAVTASYPLSFEDSTRESFFEALNEMLSVVCSMTGLIVMPPKGGVNDKEKSQLNKLMLIDSITESEAAFRFTVRQDAMSENYYVIDIGGGSTDVFLSLMDQQLHRNSYSTSLGFGARKVLLDKLRFDENRMLSLLMDRADDSIWKVISDKKEYLEDISGANGDSTIEDMFALRVPFESDHPAAALVPDNFGDAFLKYCAGTKGDLLFMQLKKRIAFYLGATVWLSGMMLRQDRNPNPNVTLLFAGNGSKMLRWLDPDLERTRYFVYQLFQQSSQTQIERDNFKCFFSAMPKEEVAFGALLDLPVGFDDDEKTSATQVFFDRENLQQTNVQSFRSLRYKRKDITTDRNEFQQFLGAYRETAFASYEWPFAKGEYDVDVLLTSRLNSAISSAAKKLGYFLGAVEVVSSYYMGETTKKESH
jgi:hypothetical protein